MEAETASFLRLREMFPDLRIVLAHCFFPKADGRNTLRLELLEKLHRDYKIYIITNGTDYIQKQRLLDSGITALTDGLFISEIVGAPKPEKQYFDYVLNNIAEKDKSKILVIGDSMTSDILGGVNAGIDTCWYNPHNSKYKYKPTYEIESLSNVLRVL